MTLVAKIKNNSVITEKVSWVIYKKDSYHILQLSNKQKAKGEIPHLADVDLVGTKLTLTGNWVNDKYGTIFHFTNATVATNEMFFFFTKIVPGIGEKTANKILDKFGDDLEDIIKNDPQRLSSIKGIKAKKIDAIVEKYEEYTSIIRLHKQFSVYGIDNELVMKIHKRFGYLAAEIINENPYEMTKIKGVTFDRADKIAMMMDFPKDSEYRINACAHSYLEHEAFNSGHTNLEDSFVIKAVANTLNLNPILITESLNHDMNVCFEHGRIGLNKLKNYEEEILEFIMSRNELKNEINDLEIATDIEEYEEDSGIKLNTEQRDAIFKAIRNRVFCLTGHAGTGKTLTLKLIMDLLAKKHGKQKIVGCAMSGIAARRLKDLTGYDSYTIHSLLKFDGDSFMHNAVDPLDYDAVILDESGMVSSLLFNALIQALPEKAVFIMAGDASQLPPIGPARVFGDILEQQLTETTVLTKIYRQNENSVLYQYANDIRNANVPKDYNGFYTDWSFFNEDPLISNLTRNKQKHDELILTRFLRLVEMEKKYAKNILTDLQILTPMKKGILGTHNLNIHIQKILNNPDNYNGHEKIEKNDKYYCLGEKVIHLENKDMKVIEYIDQDGEISLLKEKTSQQRIFNGTIGKIIEIDMFEELIYVLMNTGDVVEYGKSHLGKELDYAYALTTHKSQGAEYKVVLLPLTLSHKRMLNTQWLYTSVTRAKKRISLCGEPKAFEYACDNFVTTARQTYLN